MNHFYWRCCRRRHRQRLCHRNLLLFDRTRCVRWDWSHQQSVSAGCAGDRNEMNHKIANGHFFLFQRPVYLFVVQAATLRPPWWRLMTRTKTRGMARALLPVQQTKSRRLFIQMDGPQHFVCFPSTDSIHFHLPLLSKLHSFYTEVVRVYRQPLVQIGVGHNRQAPVMAVHQLIGSTGSRRRMYLAAEKQKAVGVRIDHSVIIYCVHTRAHVQHTNKWKIDNHVERKRSRAR